MFQNLFLLVEEILTESGKNPQKFDKAEHESFVKKILKTGMTTPEESKEEEEKKEKFKTDADRHASFMKKAEKRGTKTTDPETGKNILVLPSGSSPEEKEVKKMKNVEQEDPVDAERLKKADAEEKKKDEKESLRGALQRGYSKGGSEEEKDASSPKDFVKTYYKAKSLKGAGQEIGQKHPDLMPKIKDLARRVKHAELHRQAKDILATKPEESEDVKAYRAGYAEYKAEKGKQEEAKKAKEKEKTEAEAKEKINKAYASTMKRIRTNIEKMKAKNA